LAFLGPAFRRGFFVFNRSVPDRPDVGRRAPMKFPQGRSRRNLPRQTAEPWTSSQSRKGSVRTIARLSPPELRCFNRKSLQQIWSKYGPQKTTTEQSLSIALISSAVSVRAFVSAGATKPWVNAIKELLKLYLVRTHVRMGNGPESVIHAPQEWSMDDGSGAQCILPGPAWWN
jgi:hypothetical protein